jgi:hypothetical protein
MVTPTRSRQSRSPNPLPEPGLGADHQPIGRGAERPDVEAVEANHLACGVEDPRQLLGEGQGLLKRRREAVELLLVTRQLLERAALLVDLAEEPGILDGDDRLGCEGLEQIHGRLRECSWYFSPDYQAADHPVLAQERHGEEGAEPCLAQEGERVARFALEVGDLDGGARRRRLTDPGLADLDSRLAEGLDQRFGHSVVGARHEYLRSFVELVDGTGIRLREIDGVRDNAGEHGLHVEARADGASHLAERLQLVHEAGQLVRPLLEFREQAHILDGDHRLVGKGLEQSDLSLREEPHLGTADDDRAGGDTLTEQRDAQRGTMTPLPRRGTTFGKLLRCGLHISNLQRLPLEHHAAGKHPATDREGELANGSVGDRAMIGHQTQAVAFQPEDGGVERITQAGGTGRHGIEDGLDVGRRTADDAQDLAGRRLLLQGLGQVAVGGGQLPRAGLHLLLQALVGLLEAGRHAIERSGERFDLVPRV